MYNDSALRLNVRQRAACRRAVRKGSAFPSGRNLLRLCRRCFAERLRLSVMALFVWRLRLRDFARHSLGSLKMIPGKAEPFRNARRQAAFVAFKQ